VAFRIGNSCALVQHDTAPPYIPTLHVIRSVIYEFAVQWIQIYRNRIDFVCASLAFKVLKNFSHNKFSTTNYITFPRSIFIFFFVSNKFDRPNIRINNLTIPNISFRLNSICISSGQLIEFSKYCFRGILVCIQISSVIIIAVV